MPKKFFFYFLFMLFFINIQENKSCKCLPNIEKNLKKDFFEALAIFTGEINKEFNSTLEYEKIFQVEILDVFKGKNFIDFIGKNMNLTTCSESACCGFNFELNKNYLIWVYSDSYLNNHGKINVNICSRTSILGSEESWVLLEKLGNFSLGNVENGGSFNGSNFGLLIIFFI